MKVLVVDASIILKWVLPQKISPFQQQALSIRDALVEGKINVIVPSLWRYEVGNTLGRLVPESASVLLTHCCDVGLREVEESKARDKTALQLMSDWQVSFYDASYHALAILNRIDFVTADEKYNAKVSKHGNIILIKDWHNYF